MNMSFLVNLRNRYLVEHVSRSVQAQLEEIVTEYGTGQGVHLAHVGVVDQVAAHAHELRALAGEEEHRRRGWRLLGLLSIPKYHTNSIHCEKSKDFGFFFSDEPTDKLWGCKNYSQHICIIFSPPSS